jgi:FemAB-related protein (PEP-CTERM system-associated)
MTAMEPPFRAVPFEGPDAEWDRLVASMPGSDFCHLAAWRGIMSDVLGHQTHYSLALDASGEPGGVLPLVRVRSRLFGDYLVSMPFLSYGGPLGPPAAQKALAAHAITLAGQLGVDLLELRGRFEPPEPLAPSSRKITVLLDLPDTADELWEKGLKSKLRSQIRRPMKEGMTTEFGSGLVDDFYAVFSRTMRDLGTPVLPRRFFEAVAERFPDQALFGVVRHDGEPVAAGCGFLWNGEAEITWAGADRRVSRLAPNMLLYWSFMAETVARGGSVFNFGRCTPGSGTHRFKRQWGGRDVPLPWGQWSASAVDATPSPDSAKFRLATRTWSRLPVAVTNRLGPPLARLLP